MFIVILLMHGWHWIGAYISDEIGFHWAHFYQQQAELALGKTIPDDTIERPSKNLGWLYYLWRKYDNKFDTLKKAHAIFPQILVTIALMSIVLFLLK